DVVKGFGAKRMSNMPRLQTGESDILRSVKREAETIQMFRLVMKFVPMIGIISAIPFAVSFLLPPPLSHFLLALACPGAIFNGVFGLLWRSGRAKRKRIAAALVSVRSTDAIG